MSIGLQRSYMQQPELHNKALQRIRRAVGRAKLQHWDMTFPAFDNINLETKGVIYVIVHLPSNKMYIGQTINNAKERFFGHWSARFKSDQNKKQRNLMECMQKSNQVDDFLVWPLEKFILIHIIIIIITGFAKNSFDDMQHLANKIRSTFYIR